MEKTQQIDRVCMGSKVKMSVNGKVQTWRIVHDGGGDISQGKISLDTPLAKLVLGVKEGDMIMGKMVGKEVMIKILEVGE